MKNPKGGFWHPSQQKGWSNSSPRVGYAKGYLTDEQYYASVAIHDPLWRYIISHYDKEIYDHQNIYPITVLGYKSLPVAIELTQWGYEVTIITDRLEDFNRAKRDCEIQAGSPKQLLFFDYTKNVPRNCVICFIEIIDEFKDNAQIHSFLDLCLRRNREVVCAVKNDRDWARLLNSKYEILIKQYPIGNYLFISLKERLEA